MQNLVDSHDTNRIASAIVNADGKRFGDWGDYFNWSQKSNNKSYDARKPPNAEQIQKQKLIVAFQILYLGSPMIFYGDEAGLWGGNDPDCRKPMIWEEINYESETMNPDQTVHPADTVAFNKDLFGWYQKFLGLRNSSDAIKKGTYETIFLDDANQVYAFKRKHGTDEVVVIINRGNKPAEYQQLLNKGNYIDAFSKKELKNMSVKPMDVLVLRNRQN